VGLAAVRGRRYELLKVIGKGGFGTVYQAEVHGEGDFRKLVAIKVLRPHKAEDPELESRLRDEARVLGRLRHRAIVQVEGLVRLHGRWAVVMEFVEGVDLDRLISRGRVPVGPSLELVREAATALEVAYSRPTPGGESLNLLHRDLKPSNIRLTPAGEVKVMDFGIARADLATRETPASPLRFGTQGYLAPERVDGSGEAHASDVYALGVVLYELVCGRRLGQPGIDPGAYLAFMEEALEAVRPVDPTGALGGVLQACLAYEEQDRPDAAGLARQLRGLRQDVEGPWLYDWAAIWVPRIMIEPGKRDAALTQLYSEDDTMPDLTGSAWTASLDDPEAAELEPAGASDATTVASPAEPASPRRWVPLALAVGGLALALLVWLGTRPPDPVGVDDPLGGLVTEVSAEPVPQSPEPVAPADPVEESSATPESAPARPRKATRTAPAAKPSARVRVTGDARRVVLVLGGKRHQPGRLPEGTYAIQADFGDGRSVGAGSLRLVSGQDVTLHCDGAFFQCRVR